MKIIEMKICVIFALVLFACANFYLAAAAGINADEFNSMVRRENTEDSERYDIDDTVALEDSKYAISTENERGGCLKHKDTCTYSQRCCDSADICRCDTKFVFWQSCSCDWLG